MTHYGAQSGREQEKNIDGLQSQIDVLSTLLNHMLQRLEALEYQIPLPHDDRETTHEALIRVQAIEYRLPEIVRGYRAITMDLSTRLYEVEERLGNSSWGSK